MNLLATLESAQQIIAYASADGGTTQGGGFSITYIVIIGGMMLLSWMVSATLKRRFTEYSKISIPLTGAEVAEKMLRESGITDVKVISTPGHLTDHYDPMKKTVNLSEPVYHMASVAAAAVAAHEVGHAVQHKQAYAWLSLRSKMVPAVSFASQIQQYLMMAFIFGLFYTGSVWMLWAMVGTLAVIAGFSLVTLPVEFDASRRAMAWMERSGLAGRMENDRAQNALFWAAMTYVVGALAALAQLGYWVMFLLSRRK